MCKVCKVKDDGVASKARMVPGQRLSEISIALPDPLQLKLVRTRNRREQLQSNMNHASDFKCHIQMRPANKERCEFG